jgi:ABC-type transport system involved in multi-copper enzyme maturation permease subunit
LRSPARTPFAAVFQTETLLNSKRVVPYAMALLCGGNALLWWGWGPAEGRGWAVNSDHFIAGVLPVFSFMTLPLFTAVIMGDPVIRDYRAGITPLIFSKPVGRGAYLLGKFSGNFFTLVCCQAAFPLTLFALQWFRRPRMIVEPLRVLPYFKHFLLLVVVSHLFLAAFYFAVGTWTRNAKIVYGLAVAFYPLYAAYHVVLLNSLPMRWRVALDPLLMDWQREATEGRSAEWINHAAVIYNSDVIANRALIILIVAVCLAILYAHFSTVEQSKEDGSNRRLTTIDLGTGDERLYNVATSFDFARAAQEIEEAAPQRTVALPTVSTMTEGARAGFKQLAAATGVELRLLFAERSLVVLLPLAMLASVLGLAYYEAVPEPSYSAAYASRTADSLLLFLIAIAIFYTGEAMHRDRELRVEPVVWSVPAPNFVLLLSKFATTLLLSITTCVLVCVAAMALQIYKGHAPVAVLTYLAIYGVILLPGMAFMCAAAVALNVLLRDKYLAYAVCIALACATVYLFNLGFNNPLYNPLLYGLWTPADLTRGARRLPQILTHRIYVLALAAICLAVAHLFFARRTTSKAARAGARLRGKAWAIIVASIATAVAVVTGLMIFNAGMMNEGARLSRVSNVSEDQPGKYAFKGSAKGLTSGIGTHTRARNRTPRY